MLTWWSGDYECRGSISSETTHGLFSIINKLSGTAWGVYFHWCGLEPILMMAVSQSLKVLKCPGNLYTTNHHSLSSLSSCIPCVLQTLSIFSLSWFLLHPSKLTNSQWSACVSFSSSVCQNCSVKCTAFPSRLYPMYIFVMKCSIHFCKPLEKILCGSVSVWRVQSKS